MTAGSAAVSDLQESSVWGSWPDRRPWPGGSLVDRYARFAQTCPDSAAASKMRAAPNPRAFTRVVWGLTSRPPGSHGGLSSGFPFARRGSSPAPAFGWFPFVRRSPVVPFGRRPIRVPLRVPFPRAILTLALPRGGAAGVGPGRQGPRSPVLPRPPRLGRPRSAHAAGGQRPGTRDAAAESPGTSGRERMTSPRPAAIAECDTQRWPAEFVIAESAPLRIALQAWAAVRRLSGSGASICSSVRRGCQLPAGRAGPGAVRCLTEDRDGVRPMSAPTMPTTSPRSPGRCTDRSVSASLATAATVAAGLRLLRVHSPLRRAGQQPHSGSFSGCSGIRRTSSVSSRSIACPGVTTR